MKGGRAWVGRGLVWARGTGKALESQCWVCGWDLRPCFVIWFQPGLLRQAREGLSTVGPGGSLRILKGPLCGHHLSRMLCHRVTAALSMCGCHFPNILFPETPVSGWKS